MTQLRGWLGEYWVYVVCGLVIAVAMAWLGVLEAHDNLTYCIGN